MQWLIDIITALFTNRHRYFGRGDAGAFDFQVGDFTQDNVWRNLDLSSIVPANTVLVLLRIVCRSTKADDVFNLRTNGYGNVFNVVRVQSRIANIRNSLDIHVTPDSNGIIEYKCLQGFFDLLNVTVAGWWME